MIATEALEGTAAEWQVPFLMARAAHAHPDAAKYQDGVANIAVKVHQECKEVREVYPNIEDFGALFVKAWKDVKFRPGEDLLQAAIRLADRVPLRLTDEHQVNAMPGYKRFISMCGHLCVLLECDRIKLPRKEVAAVLSVRPATVTAYRQQAVEQGYLKVVAPHIYNPAGRGEATLFRFSVERWKYVAEKMKAQPVDQRPTPMPVRNSLKDLFG
jgi:hypothetical protein